MVLTGGGHRDNGSVKGRNMSFKLTYATMFDPPPDMHRRFEASLAGPCMRCLERAHPTFAVDAREVSQPGEAEELASPYVEREAVDLHAWARDALALALPSTLLCQPDCAGLCAVCGENLNRAGPDHAHEREPDRRWAKLSELRFD